MNSLDIIDILQMSNGKVSVIFFISSENKHCSQRTKQL